VVVPPTAPADWGYKPLEDVSAYLAAADAQLLAALLRHGHYRLEITVDEDLPWGRTERLLLTSPFAEALVQRPDAEKERLVRAIAATDDDVPESVGAGALIFREVSTDAVASADELLALVVAQGDLMKAVATGAPPIWS
jgi:hypothetical protein